MTRIHPIRRLAGIVAVLAGALLAFTAASPAAFAEHVPPAGGHGGTVQVPPQPHTIIIAGGMPGWQITLIAVAAAVIAATVAVFLDRALAARRHLTAPTT